MRKGGKILAEILHEIAASVSPGMTTGELDRMAAALCKKHDVKPAFLGYQDYPAILCVGVDDVAIHGIPSDEEILIEGQTISIDMGIIFKDMYLDHAVTVGVGTIDEEGEKLLHSTELAMKAGIAQAVAGKHTGDIGYAIEQVALLAGLSVITAMTGHGVGRKLHEEPSIPCFGERGKGFRLVAGMTVAIEAMINEGTGDLEFLSDGWTTVTQDGMRSAIFEHTVLVGDKSPEILTIR
ncbi:MAG: Methionine aminopeptidase 1 [candidate division WS6 bacterium OLB20]|uniref:Methionine aminopeptidase n=1 Tax=candidate division WS6 bacterium OLB20 TaxID=1617426 RepID=A0A136LX12_9BACT|nr:MAG: Methionine aminopeptidase 1 [candidate division WS6 bacterium OLB20]